WQRQPSCPARVGCAQRSVPQTGTQASHSRYGTPPRRRSTAEGVPALADHLRAQKRRTMVMKNVLKRSRTTGERPEAPQVAPAGPKPLEMPYVGVLREDQDPLSDDINAGRRAGELALGGWHTLLCGLTGKGKGRAVIMPGILMWGDQPVIAMSTKGDLVEGTIRKRSRRGPVYLLDLSKEVKESELRGVEVTRVMSDPCTLVNSDDEAMAMSDLLQATAKVGSASGGDAGNSDPTWENLAARPLAALIRAGGALPHPKSGELIDGGGIRWVLDALDH